MKLIHVPVHLKASASALVIPPAADPLGSQSTTANQGKDLILSNFLFDGFLYILIAWKNCILAC